MLYIWEIQWYPPQHTQFSFATKEKIMHGHPWNKNMTLSLPRPTYYSRPASSKGCCLILKDGVKAPLITHSDPLEDPRGNVWTLPLLNRQEWDPGCFRLSFSMYLPLVAWVKATFPKMSGEKVAKDLPFFYRETVAHRIHVWYIYLHLP